MSELCNLKVFKRFNSAKTNSKKSTYMGIFRRARWQRFHLSSDGSFIVLSSRCQQRIQRVQRVHPCFQISFVVDSQSVIGWIIRRFSYSLDCGLNRYRSVERVQRIIWENLENSSVICSQTSYQIPTIVIFASLFRISLKKVCRKLILKCRKEKSQNLGKMPLRRRTSSSQ